ncbi:MAG TPA: hypothetical protein VN668_16390 [Stellaceae bacterium]|nr:hypothetical protein [Stellaceae bacterium]
MEDEEQRRERVAWTVRRAVLEGTKRREARKVGVLRLKPFPRIELEDDGKN